MTRFQTLAEWLQWQEQLHPSTIDLGLQRIYEVARRLELIDTPSTISHEFSGALSYKPTVITVAGTNGKGSCIATMERLLMDQGLSVGSYTSPHLHHYNERIKINGNAITDQTLCDAFTAIDTARGDISLTYFEFGTLAALFIFVQQQVPYVLLEVGLGGRLDAVNIVDTDIAIVTSIAIDHQEWLGNDRNVISAEKLGIARDTRPLIITETELTGHLQAALHSYSVQLLGRDFTIDQGDSGMWHYQWQGKQLDIPPPVLPAASVAAALTALNVIGCLPKPAVLVESLTGLRLAGRFEHNQVNGIRVIFDVAHNPAAASLLASQIENLPQRGKVMAVMAVMADKAIDDILAPLVSQVSRWYVGDLVEIPRAAKAMTVAEKLFEQGCQVDHSETIEIAFTDALSAAVAHDTIVVFGSFYTVSAVRQLIMNGDYTLG